MSKATGLLPIFLTVVLDAAGIGLVLPVLPDLFGATAGGGTAGFAYGFFLSLYALMQFLFAPLFGSLSDRIGRKPVLLAALGGAMINYAAMACLPPLWLLFVLRAIAGVTGGSISVASAYIADLSAPEERATRFGQLSACFGIGFILGPAAGGLLREIGLNWPFAIAAVVAGLNLLLCLVTLPESRAAEPSKAAFDPLSGFRDIGQFRPLLPLLLTCAVFALIGEIGGSLWVFYTHQKFHWSGITVGISLTLFGLFHALAQAVLIGPTLFLSLYFATRGVFPGLVWIIGAALYLVSLPVILRRSTY